MTKNTGIKFENEVYETVKKLVESNDFLISNPNVKYIKRSPITQKTGIPILFVMSRWRSIWGILMRRKSWFRQLLW